MRPLFDSSWSTTWHELGASADPAWRDVLLACYAEPHRACHTQQHLHECLLGAPPERFDEYERQVCIEYAAVPRRHRARRCSRRLPVPTCGAR